MAKAYIDICPCKDCDKRITTCHSTCKEYKDWQSSGVEILKTYRVVKFRFRRKVK